MFAQVLDEVTTEGWSAEALVLAAACGDAPALVVEGVGSGGMAELVAAVERVRTRLEAWVAPAIVALGVGARDVLTESGVARREAGRRCTVARGLERLAATAEALQDGRLGIGHVEHLARNADRLSGATEARLVALAKGLSAEAFGRVVERELARELERDDRRDPEEGARRRRSWRRADTFSTSSGMGVLRVESDPVVHAELAAIIDDAVDVLWRAEHPDRAPSLVERASAAQRRHDAVVAIFRRWRDGDANGAGRGRRPVVAALVDAGVLFDGLAAKGVATLVDGTPISVGEARQLAVEHGVLPVVMGGPSQVLDLGRRQRLASDAQRLALEVAYRGCAVARCDRPGHHVHHRHEWERGGRSDLSNLVPLCGGHHRRVHREGRELRARADGRYELGPPRVTGPP